MGRARQPAGGMPSKRISDFRLNELKRAEARLEAALERERNYQKKATEKQAQLPKDLGKILGRYD